MKRTKLTIDLERFSYISYSGSSEFLDPFDVTEDGLQESSDDSTESPERSLAKRPVAIAFVRFVNAEYTSLKRKLNEGSW